MKKALRFTALVGILATTVLLGTGPKAQAIISCDILQGSGCFGGGLPVECLRPDGSMGFCDCIQNQYSCQ